MSKAAPKADTAIVCSICDADTKDTTDLVPSRTKFKVVCSNGHVTNGIPKERNRA